MIRVLRLIPVGLLTLFAVGVRAADDWIDELPTVTAVAHAVSDQLKVDTANWRFDVRGIALKDDDDLFAVYMVGTLVLLRQIILYKYQEEKTLTSQREAKLRSTVAAYLEAELLIGQAVGKRRGYLTTAQKCRDSDCYRRWFKTGVSNVGGASYRRRILARLFPCDDKRADELDRLAQSYAGRAPYLPSPAETLRVEPELAGVAPAGCSTSGGDTNGNGLCDDWENASSITGLDGPYCSPDLAVHGHTGERALILTKGDNDSSEYGFLILRNLSAPSRPYYATPVTRSTQPRTTSGQPLFGLTDYFASLKNAFAGSGAKLANFILVAAVHTHPPDLDFPFRGGPGSDAIGFKNDNFTMRDFNIAFYFRGTGTAGTEGLVIQRDFEKIYVITARNGCIKAFKPLDDDPEFTDAELLLSEVPRSSDRYAKYFDRQVEIYCFKEP